MEKRLMSKLLTTTIIATSLMFTIPAYADTIAIKIVLNGQEISYNQESGFPYIDNNGRTLVPFRQTMEAFGCDVNWNQDSKTATAIKNGTTVQVPIGQAYVLKNDEKVTNDTEAVIKDGKTYLPIAIVLRSFGADVNWDNTAKAVVAKSVTQTPTTTDNIPTVGTDENTISEIKKETQNNPTYVNDDVANPPVVIPVDNTPNINNLNINTSDYEAFLSHFEIKQLNYMYDTKLTKIVIQLRFKDSNEKQILQQFLQSMDYITLQSYTVQLIKDKCMNYDRIGIAYMTQNEDIVFNAVEIANKNGTLIYSPITWGKSWE